MLIRDICIDRELQETIFYENPLLQHSLYIVEYDNYMRDQIPWHWHNEMELLYLAAGACIYRTSYREYYLQAGDAIYLNPGVLHALEPTEEKTVSYANLFDRTFLTGAEGSYFDVSYTVPVFQQKSVEAVPVYHHAEGTEQVLDLIRKTIAICREEPPFFALTLRNVLSEIWIYLCQRIKENQSRADGQQMEARDARVKQMLLYIMEHYQEKCSVPELAAAASISERECYRLFRQQLGQTPNLFLQQYRIQKAKRLLCTTEIPVTEVAFSAGFESTSYFGKIFRSRTGMTPFEFRASHKALEETVSH